MSNINKKVKSVRFYLKNKKDGWGSIVAIFNFRYIEDGQYRFYQQSSGEEIPIESWDSNLQRIKKGSFHDWDRINRKLNSIENEIIERYDEMVRNNLMITPESLRTYSNSNKKQNLIGTVTLVGFAKQYKQTCGKNYKTIRHYGTTINVLEEYSRSKKMKFKFDDIDLSFYHGIVKFLEGKNLRINTIGGHIKNLKVFLRQSYSQKIHNNNIFEHSDFKVLQEDVDSIYLNLDELGQMFRLDLSYNKTLEQTRDAFILGAFTGLRFSDIQNLKPENIGEDGIIKTTAIKTKKQVCIPIGNVTQKILNKYFPNLPKIYSNQKFNDYLKIIAKKAGLSDEITITHSNGGIHKTYKYPKYSLVSTHTARRSFATNMMLAGVNVSQIMLITGHRTEASFFQYIKIRPKENASILKNHHFFNFKLEEETKVHGLNTKENRISKHSLKRNDKNKSK